MKNKLIIPLLFLGLVIMSGWGYSQYQAKRQWEINAENQYQRAFEELTANTNNMETELSKVLVAGSFPQTINLLTNTWREANSCQENLGQLPLTSLELSRTKQLLAKVSAFCLATAQNCLTSGKPVDEKGWSQLKSFRDQTKIVTQHLMNLQQQFYSNRTKWLEVDRLGVMGAAGMAEKFNNNKVTKSFLMLEDGLRRVPDVEFEGDTLDYVPKPSGLTGKDISSKEAVTIAKKCLGPQYRDANFKYERIIRGGFPTYMIAVTDPKNADADLRLSISVKGGHLAWLLGNRMVADSRMDYNQAEAKAQTFLGQNGYPNLKCVAREKYSNMASLTLVPERSGVLYYPELVKCQVALDNGDILGVDTIGYLTFNEPNKKTMAAQPQYSKEQIKGLLNKHLKPTNIRMVQVLDEMYNKVLCYEVTGMQGADRYMIYYNANTGKEEKIRRVDQNGNELL